MLQKAYFDKDLKEKNSRGKTLVFVRKIEIDSNCRILQSRLSIAHNYA